MNLLMVNTVTWLTQRSSFTGFNVVVAQQSSSMEAATRAWFANHYSGVTLNGISIDPANQTDNRCDNGLLDACLQNADLLVVGQDLGSSYNREVVITAG